eukprot:scaffold92293_cov31-Tisochrysis_lutea.AAC.2
MATGVSDGLDGWRSVESESPSASSKLRSMLSTTYGAAQRAGLPGQPGLRRVAQGLYCRRYRTTVRVWSRRHGGQPTCASVWAPSVAAPFCVTTNLRSMARSACLP